MLGIVEEDIVEYQRDSYESTVDISTYYSGGSGVIIRSNDGYHYVLTCCHVVEELIPSQNQPTNSEPEEFSNINIPGVNMKPGDLYISQKSFWSEARYMAPAKLLAYDMSKDLALIRFHDPQRSFETAELCTYAEWKTLTPQSDVYAVGCPNGIFGVTTEGTVAEIGDLYITTSTELFYGNSGGGLYDAETGKLIGITVRFAAVGFKMANHLTQSVGAHAIADFLSAWGYEWVVDR